MTRRAVCLMASLGLLLAAGPFTFAEVFVLSTGGRVTGEWVNRDESPRKNYVIKVSSGGRVTLDKSQVKQVLRPRPAELQYEKIRPSYPDTVEGQWALAEWCLEQRLSTQRKTHLNRIIELDPDHQKARQTLGYHQQNGKWMTQEQVMHSRGYQRYKGRWRTSQEIELMENRREIEGDHKEWARKLKRWRGWLDGKKDPDARRNILAIDDPQAVKALARALREDHYQPAQLLYIEALARIGVPEAVKALAVCSLEDPIEEVRLTCLDYLEKEEHPEVVEYYVGKLRSKDNRVINLAALGLARIKDHSAIGPLVDALVTTHKFKVTTGNPGATSATFPTNGTPGGGGLSVGSKTHIISRQIRNQSVLDALAVLSEQNFGFDQRAWKSWHASQRKRQDFDARRD